jgi:hypothetical protein
MIMQYCRLPVAGQSPLDKRGPFIMICEVNPRSHKREPEYWLLPQESGINHKELVFCRFWGAFLTLGALRASRSAGALGISATGMAIFGRLTPQTFPPKPIDLRPFDYLLCVGYFLYQALFAKVRKATVGFVQVCHVRTRKLSSNRKDLHEIWYFSVFRKICPREFRFYYNLTRITGTLHEDLYTFYRIPLNYFRMRNVSDKLVQ